ncbi:unnamed protein product, partial [Clonostachys rosea f. rosea IK726]
MHVVLLDITRPFRSDSPDPQPGMDDLCGARQFAQCRLLGQSLRRPYSVSASIGQSLLAITLRDTEMSGQEAWWILQQLEHQDVA